MDVIRSIGTFVCKCFSLILKGLACFFGLGAIGGWLAAIISFIDGGIAAIQEILVLFVGGFIVMFLAAGLMWLGGKLDDMVGGIDLGKWVGSGTYSGSYSSSSSFDPGTYVTENCTSYIYGVLSDADINTIKQDPHLTSSQKEAAIEELKHKSDLYY